MENSKIGRWSSNFGTSMMSSVEIYSTLIILAAVNGNFIEEILCPDNFCL